MILLLSFAFLSGLVTILAPCIWPLLPIILSSSIAGSSKSHHRPLGITLGIMVSFAFFTLAISYLVKLFHFDPNVLRIIAVIVIGFLGLTMIIPAFLRILELLISKLTTLLGQTGQKTRTGFGGGFITGLALGIVWSPCAGPILAAIATLAATGKVTLDVILVTIAYVIGVGIPLFIFAYGGQQLITKTRFISAHTGRIQQIFGVIMILTAIAIYTNYDQYLQATLLNAFPQFSSTLNSFESNSALTKQLDVLKGSAQNANTATTNQSDLFNTNTPAPDFVGINKWLNTDKPISIKDLKGKVVLVDFWTYTCINCIRTLPFVTSWYDKYHDQGFVVIGVHTPEFQFEHDTNNVLHAINMYKIHYPVAQDNDYTTWNNYNNQYWPAEYLIDVNGNVRRTHFGEGEYDQTEMAIRELLKDAGKNINGSLTNMTDQTPQEQLSPETYLGLKGLDYSDQYHLPGITDKTTQQFSLNNNLGRDEYSLGGEWTIDTEDIIAGDNAVLNYNFTANKVFIILRSGSAPKNSQVKVFFDDKPITSSIAGSDVKDGIITVDSDRLYNVVDLHGKTENHILRLEYPTPGIEVFTFTFG